MKKIIIFLIIALFLVSCASSPGPTPVSKPSGKPGWVDNKYSKYPEVSYMVEVGQGSSLKDAKRNGAASLAAIFKTSMRVETSIQTRYKELSTGGDTQSSEETSFDEDITQLVDQELINVNFGESWTDNLGKVFILAYIDRQLTGNIYRDRINENIRTVDNFLDLSKEQSSIIREYAYFDAAYVVAQANQVLMEQLEILNRPLRKTIRTSYNLDEVRNNRMESALNMAFNVQIENDVDGNVASVIKDKLTAFGFRIDSGGILSVTGDVRLEKVALDNDYENIRYYININIEDEEGVPIVTIEKNKRVSAVSESDAKNRAYLDIEKALNKELLGELVVYLDGFVR